MGLMREEENIVLLHKEKYRRMMAKIWSLYDKVPKRRKKKALKIIEEWIQDKIAYDRLVEELEKLANG